MNNSAPAVFMEAAAGAATSGSPVGLLIMLLFWPALAGLIVFLIIRGKKKRAAALKPAVKPTAAPANTVSAANESIDAIERLAKLHQQGILTDEEFTEKRKRSSTSSDHPSSYNKARDFP